MSSLALPAALATAGLLNTAEAAYATALGSDTRTAAAPYAHQGQPIGGDATLTSANGHPCSPIGNVTITDYGHCCTPVGNITITDYSYCCTPVGNITICDYGNHQEHEHGHHDHDHDRGRQLRSS